MEPRNLLILTPARDAALPGIEATCLDMIREAAPGLNINDGSKLVVAEMKGDSEASAELDRLLADTDIIFGLVSPRDLVRRAPKLKWFHAASAGIDYMTGTNVWDSSITITGSSGIHATVISEFVMGTMLALAKNTALALENKRSRLWKNYETASLHGMTVGIVGLGHIGREIARLSRAFGMEVIATRRSAGKTGRARHVDQLLPHGELKQLLSHSDFVVISVPLTPETKELIGREELKAMKPSAYLINIARGEIIDEEALIDAIENGDIAGAGLDVTTREPLPADSPLWDLPNVILTPHVAGGMKDYMQRATRLFCDNLIRYREGRKMLNVVNRQRGY